MSEQREALKGVIQESAAFKEMFDLTDSLDWYFCIDPDETTSAMIAHLWEQAMKPEVVEAVAQGIHAEVWSGDEHLMPWGKCLQERYVEDARRALPATLTALLGPRPGQEADDE